jgi:hypothetical protein
VSRERTLRTSFGKSEIEMALTQQRTAESDAMAFDAIEWALRLGVGLVYVGIGCEKVFPSRDSYWVKMFAEIGFGLWAILTHLFLLNTGVGGAVIPAAFLGLIVAAVRRRFTDRSGAQPMDLR